MPLATLPVTFVLLGQDSLAQLEQLQPDHDWQEFLNGTRAWILQTYLRLRDRGRDVRLSASLPPDGIAVFNTKERHLLREADQQRTRAMLVSVRQDSRPALMADFELVQNHAQADERMRFFMPHWPQPGLVPRAPDRGARIETIAFKGLGGNLHPEFRSAAWREFLVSRGLRWVDDAITQDNEVVAWNDFSTVDLLLAVRPPDPRRYLRKPATKLYNAWLAGVPALLGCEPAYRELRCSPLDYIEVDSRVAAQEAIDALLRQPDRYLSMIEHCRRRASAFTVERISTHWEVMLFDTLPALRNAPHVRGWQGKSLRLKENVRRLARALRLRDYKG